MVCWEWQSVVRPWGSKLPWIEWLFYCSVVLTLWSHGLQHSRLSRPSLSPRICTSIESVVAPNHLILCHPLLLLPFSLSQHWVFSNELPLRIRWPKYWSFTFSISPFNEYSGLIFFRINWFDLLAVQGTLKSLLQHHSLKASIFQHSAFSMVQLVG